MAIRPLSVADPQRESLLFQRLPQELRDKIYSHVFSSTRLHWRKAGRTWIRPAPNALSLSRSCRRAHGEIGDSWIGLVLFSFGDIKAMLDKLTLLPPATLSKIRQMRVQGDTLNLSFGDAEVFCRMTSILNFIPVLRLDTLTVLGHRNPQGSYWTLNGLIKESRGWKELRYISHSSELLGFLSDHSADEERKHSREAQPAHWQRILENRDGASSRPSVAIYRSTVAGCRSSILDPSTRVPFSQRVPQSTEEREVFRREEHDDLMAPEEKGKELLIVARRGFGVDYEQRPDAQLTGTSIREDLAGKTWTDIKRERIERLNLLFGGDMMRFTEARYEDVVDTYQHIDEYEWSRLPFMND